MNSHEPTLDPGTRLEVADSLEGAWDLFDAAEARGWTDGLPVLPATPRIVDAMLGTLLDARQETVATLAPAMGAATLEKIAVCAAMAGCRPEYFPVVVAAVRAAAVPRYGLRMLNTTTNPVAPLILVNGPIRDTIGLNYRDGVLGPGFRANATIGRAVSLVMSNIAGRVPGSISKSTHGQPGRFTFCLAEYEEANPWEPYHVEQGFAPDASVVTLMAPTGTMDIFCLDYLTQSAEAILVTIAQSVSAIGMPSMSSYYGLAPMLLVMCTEYAGRLAAAGYSKQSLKESLFERTQQIPLEVWPEDVRAELIRTGRTIDGKYTPLVNRPDQFDIVVSGGPVLHCVFMPTFGDSWPVSTEI
jgi:hypothetical protein